MQFSAIALLAATVAAAPNAARQANDLSIVFEVSDFQASCVPHSAQCNYSFKVIKPFSMDTAPISCAVTGTAGFSSTLPDVTEGPCENSSRTFNVVRNAQGLKFSVSSPVSPISNTTGVYQIPGSDLDHTHPENPNGAVEFYKGPKAFALRRED